MEPLSPDKSVLRKFSVTMISVLAAVILLSSARQKYGYAGPCLLGVSFFFAGFFFPFLLRPVYRFWMRLAFALGWVNTRVLLSFVFYLIFFPIGLAMRIFRVDPLERRIEKDKPSYWKEKEKGEFDPLQYERQF